MGTHNSSPGHDLAGSEPHVEARGQETKGLACQGCASQHPRTPLMNLFSALGSVPRSGFFFRQSTSSWRTFREVARNCAPPATWVHTRLRTTYAKERLSGHRCTENRKVVSSKNLNPPMKIDKNICTERLEITVFEIVVKAGPPESLQPPSLDFPRFTNKRPVKTRVLPSSC